MAVFLFDRGSRNKDQQQQEEEKKKKAESRHQRHDDGLYGSVVSSSSSSKSGNSHSKGPSSIECDSSPNITSPSSDCSARNEADGAGGGGWYGDGFEGGGGGGGAAYEAGSYQLGSYRHYGGGSGVFPSPAPRRSLSPIGSSEWALRECEVSHSLSVSVSDFHFIYRSVCVTLSALFLSFGLSLFICQFACLLT